VAFEFHNLFAALLDGAVAAEHLGILGVPEICMDSAARSSDSERFGKFGYSALLCGLKVINVQHEDPAEFGNRDAVRVGMAIAGPLLDHFGVGGSDLLPSRKRGVPVSGIGRYNTYATHNHAHGDFFEFCGVVHLTLFLTL